MTKKNKKIYIILNVFAILWIAFIFGNSLKTADASGMQSEGIVNFVIDKILNTPIEKQSIEFVDLVTHFVRKVAHFTEFAILGVIIFLICYITDRSRLKSSIFSVCLSFCVAVCDELLQLTSEGRACRFSDVLIDTSGAAFACLMMFLIVFLISKRKKQ